MNDIENSFTNFNNIYKHKITCRYLTSITHYNLLLNISKIKLDLIKIMKNCGSDTIEDIIKLILNKKEQKIIFNKYNEIYFIYNTYFNPISFILYTKNEEINLIKETSNINKYPICIKNKDIQISLIEKLLECKYLYTN